MRRFRDMVLIAVTSAFLLVPLFSGRLSQGPWLRYLGTTLWDKA